MKPDEKANEIYESMRGFRVKKHHIKKCALVCVQNIINANPHSNPLNTDAVYSTMDYWLEVKSEIHKL